MEVAFEFPFEYFIDFLSKSNPFKVLIEKLFFGIFSHIHIRTKVHNCFYPIVQKGLVCSILFNLAVSNKGMVCRIVHLCTNPILLKFGMALKKDFRSGQKFESNQIKSFLLLPKRCIPGAPPLMSDLAYKRT